MISVRQSRERGAVSMGWLEAKHSFSFGSYHDPETMGFGPLRVINEDRIQPARGFGMHGHRDMEIITYIIDGALERKGNMGDGSVIRRGDVQRMSAGTGVMHSEFIHSSESATHLLQIWILPAAAGITPGYEEKAFPDHDEQNQLRLIASHDARGGSLKIHRDVDLSASVLESGGSVQHRFGTGHFGWIQVVSGQLAIGGIALGAGDGAAIVDEPEIAIAAHEKSEFLLFDLA